MPRHTTFERQVVTAMRVLRRRESGTTERESGTTKPVARAFGQRADAQRLAIRIGGLHRRAREQH